MTKLNAFSALLFQLLFLFTANGQRPETKESSLHLRISTDTYSTTFFAYECGYGVSDWKNVLNEDICATLVWAGNTDSLGCNADTSVSLEGKIALIRLGGCPVATKALYAQQAGAKAVFIAQNNPVEDPANPKYIHTLGVEDSLPAVRIPVLFLEQSNVSGIDTAFQTGTDVMACLTRPPVFLNSVAFPSREIQQFCISPIAPFRFSVRLSNLSGMNLQNVVVKGVLQNNVGQELLSSVLQISEIDSSVTDSLYEFPDIYNNINMFPGDHQVIYTVEGSLNDLPFIDTRRVKFNANTPVLATELSGAQVGYRPDSIPETGWAIANLFYVPDDSDELYQVYNASISVMPGAEMSAEEQMYITLYLFMVNEDIHPDLSNFNPNEFSSESMALIGVGAIAADITSNQPSYQTQIINLQTAEPDLLLEPGKYYLLAASFEGESRFIYQGFNEDYRAGEANTLVYTDKWHTGGLYGAPNAVLRLQLSIFDLDCTISNTQEPSSINFEVYPNPAQDNLTIQVAFHETSDAQITFFDMTGRIIASDYRKGLNNETFHYPVSQFPNGTYAMRMTTKEGSCTKKVMIHKE